MLEAQQAAIAVTRPGARKQDAHWAAVRVLAQGMLDAGLLDRNKVGDVEAVIGAPPTAPLHDGTGRWLGRDVHDVGEVLALDEPPVEQRDGFTAPRAQETLALLRPGMVITVEPGLYVRPAEGDAGALLEFIGIRIGDDAVITADRLRADQPRRAGRPARDRDACARLKAEHVGRRASGRGRRPPRTPNSRPVGMREVDAALRPRQRLRAPHARAGRHGILMAWP